MDAISQSVGKIRSFTDLHAWREAHVLVLKIYKLVQNFPLEEKIGLKTQICRAVVSISSNIAEGFKRKSRKEKRQFYTTALASLTEVQNQLLIAKDVHYLDEKQFTETAEHSIRVSKLINGILKSAQSFK